MSESSAPPQPDGQPQGIPRGLGAFKHHVMAHKIGRGHSNITSWRIKYVGCVQTSRHGSYISLILCYGI